MHLSKIRSLAMVGALAVPALAPGAQAAPFTCNGIGILDPSGGAALINLAFGVVGCILIPGATLTLGGAQPATAQPSATVGTHSNGTTIVYSYDALGGGGLAQSTDTAGMTTQYHYDGSSRMTMMTDPLGRTTTYEYDSSSNRVTKSETTPQPPNTTTTYTYDLSNRVSTHLTSPGGTTTTYDYDGSNRLSQTDDNGASPPLTSYTYDVQDRLSTSVDPLGRTTRYEYDGLSNRVEKTERDDDGDTNPDRRTTYTYDFNDRLVQSVLEPTPQNPQGQSFTTTYTYDQFGRYESSSDGLTEISVEYVPEPEGLALFGAALAALAAFGRARRREAQPAR